MVIVGSQCSSSSMCTRRRLAMASLTRLSPLFERLSISTCALICFFSGRKSTWLVAFLEADLRPVFFLPPADFFAIDFFAPGFLAGAVFFFALAALRVF